MTEPPGAAGGTSGSSVAESIAVVRNSEADRLLRPTRYGGGAVGTDEFVAAVADLAARDASAGWLAAEVNAAAHAVAHLGEAATERVWGTEDGALVSAGTDPAGRLTRDRRALRLSGRWGSVTGAECADWLLLSALDDDTQRCVLLPRDAVRVDHPVGLRGLDGAGIGDVTVSDAVIDATAVFSCDTAEYDEIRTVAGVGQAAAVVGAAAGVWEAHVGQVRQRLATSYGSEDTAELTSSAVLVAKAASDIDAARLQLVASCGADAAAAATARRQAVTRARDAADQLLGSGSRHALDATDPVARRWFDVLAGYRMVIRRVGGSGRGR